MITRQQIHRYSLDVDRNGKRIYGAHADIVAGLIESGATVTTETPDNRGGLFDWNTMIAMVLVDGVEVGYVTRFRNSWSAMAIFN